MSWAHHNTTRGGRVRGMKPSSQASTQCRSVGTWMYSAEVGETETLQVHGQGNKCLQPGKAVAHFVGACSFQ